MSEDAKSSAERVRIEFERLVREGYGRRDAYVRAVIKEADSILGEKQEDGGGGKGVTETLFGLPITERGGEDFTLGAADVILGDWRCYSGRVKLLLEKKESGGWVLRTSEPIGADILRALKVTGT